MPQYPLTSYGNENNPILLPGNIPDEHHIHLKDTSDKSSKDELDDGEVVAAAGIMPMFAGCRRICHFQAAESLQRLL